MNKKIQDLSSKRREVSNPNTLPPCYPATYEKWRITLTNGDVVVRKFYGRQDEVLAEIWDAQSAVPIGRPVDEL
jgi:hypothetical protein